MAISAPRFGERSEPERGAEMGAAGGSLGLRWPGGFRLAWAMQIRASSFQGDRPSCPLNPNHPVHVHGSYDRYANCDDGAKEEIPRYLCVPCGRTLSVLPDHVLPYRAVGTPLLEQHFDAQADPGQAPAPPATQKEKGCLKRAWARFKRRVAPLSATLGQMIRPVKPTAAQFWKQLRRQSNLAVILRELARPFNLSLLGNYRCLAPWSPSAG